MFYYGVRWAKGCHPDEFWKIYFTSSESVALLRTLYGDESFEFEIRKIFDDKLKVREWEYKVLRRMKVLENQDMWLNRTDNKSIMNTKDMMDKSQKKRIKTLKLRGSLSGANNPMFGLSTSDLQKRRASESTKKLKWYTNGFDNVRLNINSYIPKNYWSGRTMKHNENGIFV
jgi:hypothetical protein